MNKHRRLYFSIFIIVCFLLTVLSSQNSTVLWLDAQMFRFASHLLPVQSSSNDFRVIHLDEARLQDPQGIRELRFLLRKLRKSGAAEIVWLSDDFPQMDYVRAEDGADSKAAKKSRSKSGKGDEEQQWKPTQGERNKLAWMLENQRVFLTQYASTPRKQNSIPYTETLLYNEGWRQYIPAVFLPAARTFRLTNTELPYRVYPFNTDAASEQALVWYDETRSFSLPDLSLAVYSRFIDSGELSWSESGRVSLDGLQIKTNLSGKVYAYFSELTGRHTELDVLSLLSASKKSNSYFKNKLVLIGQDTSRLQVLADALSSMQANASYHTPAMSWWMSPLLLVLVASYLLFIMPLLSRQGGLFLSAFLVLGMVSAQPVMLILEGIWWPTVNMLLLMFVGQLAVYVYLSGRAILDDLLRTQHRSWFQLGHYQYEKGDHESAITSLLKCYSDDEVLADLYDIGLNFERKRQYDRALQVYSEIHHRRKNYRDIDQRLKSISGISSGSEKITPPGQLQKTLVMSQVETPELGRYKIEKEIGRGAMGIVYLGKDPKINRQVAIKTLDYTQFSDKELKTVKSRFFREAEAAGRLGHNNIVTVYDVGEEDDFGFIAMDYVDGEPLSNYTGSDNLLPVDEVYRIIQSVAEALDYAHRQNIVHRDIKPGNIMYNRDDRQVKITDFGIARITDSVKTKTGSFLGSPFYMAPEQMSAAHVDGRADIYALGVSFYQLLTGQLPYKADSLANLAHKIANEKHKPVRDVRPDLPASATRIINKAMQKNPDKRYASGTEMANAIGRELADS